MRASACCDLLIRNCPVQFAARVCSCPGPASSRACEIVASFAIIRVGIVVPGGAKNATTRAQRSRAFARDSDTVSGDRGAVVTAKFTFVADDVSLRLATWPRSYEWRERGWLGVNRTQAQH